MNEQFTPCPTHGTISAYTNKKCRCDVCRRNNTIRARIQLETQRTNRRRRFNNELAELEQRIITLESALYRLEAEA